MPLAMFHSAYTSGRLVFCEIEPIEHSHESENKHLIHLREGLLYSGPHKIRLFLNNQIQKKTIVLEAPLRQFKMQRMK